MSYAAFVVYIKPEHDILTVLPTLVLHPHTSIHVNWNAFPGWQAIYFVTKEAYSPYFREIFTAASNHDALCDLPLTGQDMRYIDLVLLHKQKYKVTQNLVLLLPKLGYHISRLLKAYFFI
jgi:hypothetical protein